MVPTDDGRHTLLLNDRYIIEPLFAFWNRESYQEHGATAVPEDFMYASDTNDEWLNAKELKELMEQASMSLTSAAA